MTKRDSRIAIFAVVASAFGLIAAVGADTFFTGLVLVAAGVGALLLLAYVLGERAGK